VSVVEDLEKAREPLPLPAVYFITPSPASVTRLVADFAKAPLYPSVHVFFSSRCGRGFKSGFGVWGSSQLYLVDR
jgi:syntaxin-binding protein 1